MILRLLMTAMQAAPASSPSALAASGEKFLEAQRVDEARQAFEGALRLEAANFAALRGMGIIDFSQGRFAQSRIWLEKAAQARPNSFQVRFLLGAVLVELSDPKGAIEQLTVAHRLDPTHTDVRKLLAAQYSATGQYKQAIALLGPAIAAYNAFLLDARSQGTSRAPRLKIKEIRAVRIRGVVTKYVRVYTDQGLTGTGETVDTVGAEFIINNHLGPALVGRDPLDIEGIYWDLWTWKQAPGGIPPVFMRGMGGPYLAAMSGIDMALWDLAGKALGVPVYRLLAGRVRNKLAVYHHSGDPNHAKNLVKRTGVRGIKTGVDGVTQQDNDSKGWDPGKMSNYSLTNAQIDNIVKHVAAMREALGMDFGLMLECHTRYDIESAIQMAKALEPYRPMWLEEPVPSDNPDAMAKVREMTRIPIAAGENIYTRFGFRPFLEKQALSIIQPDMAKAGGLLEARKIASLAELYHVPIAPHGVASTLGKVAFAHVCATVPNFLILEWAHIESKVHDSLTTAANYKDGFVELSDAPGIGIEVHDEAVKQLQEPAGGTSL